MRVPVFVMIIVGYVQRPLKTLGPDKMIPDVS